MVRRRRVGARTDDREVGGVVTLGDEPLADLPGDVRLGPPDEPSGGDRVDDAVGGRPGLAEQRDLLGILDHPQLAQDGRGRLEAGRQDLLEPEQVARPEGVADADLQPGRAIAAGPPPLPADASRTRSATRRCADSVSSHVRRSTKPAAAAGQPRAGSASRRGTTRLGRAPGAAGSDEHRQALQRHRRVAGQVAQVGADADEQGRQPLLGGDPLGRGEPRPRSARPGSRARGGAGRRSSATRPRADRSSRPSRPPIVAAPAGHDGRARTVSASTRYGTNARRLRRPARAGAARRRRAGPTARTAAPAATAAAIASTPS